MLIQVRAGRSATLERYVIETGTVSILQFEIFHEDNQVEFKHNLEGAPQSTAIIFIPDATFRVAVQGAQFAIMQSDILFATGSASVLDFNIVKRSIYLDAFVRFYPQYLEIIQLAALLRPAAAEEEIDVVIRKGTGLKFLGDIGINLLNEHFQELSKDGSSIYINSVEFTALDKLFVEAYDAGVLICCERSDFVPMSCPRYLELVVAPPRDYEVIDFHLKDNPLFKIIQAFQENDLKRPTKESNPFVRRSFVLARFAIFSSECCKELKILYGEGAEAIFDPIIKMLSTQLPVGPLVVNPQPAIELDAQGRRISGTAPHLGAHNVRLDDVNYATFLASEDMIYEIGSSVRNILMSYINRLFLEAPLGALFWTPLLNIMWVPNENERHGNLYSTVELPLRFVPGCIRQFRADYALIDRELFPIVIGEYAASSPDKEESKDLVLGAFEAEFYQNEFIGRHRDRKFKEVLLNLCCFPMFFTADEMQITIMRPLFDIPIDGDLQLKGYALNNDRRFKFRLLSREGEEDSDISPEILAEGLELMSSFDKSTQNAAEQMEAVLNRISDLKFGRKFPANTKNTCPLFIDRTRVNVNILRLIRQVGIFFHRYSSRMRRLLAQAGPPDPAQRAYTVPKEVQNSQYAKAIDKETPAAMRYRTSNPHATPASPTEHTVGTNVLTKMVEDTPYFYHLCPVRKQTCDLVFTSKSDAANCPKKAVFFLRGGDMMSENCFLKHVACKAKVAEVIPHVVFHMPVPSRNCYLLGLESLVPFEDAIGRNIIWFADITRDLARIVMDILVAIKIIAKAGWAHGNICPENIMYSTGTRIWKLTSLANIRPLKAKTEPAQIGTYPFIDPLVQNGARKSVKTELFSLGASLQYIMDSWATPKMLADPTIGQRYVDRLRPFQEFAEYLRGHHPSISEALQRAREFGVKELGEGGWRFKRLDKLMRPKEPTTQDKSGSSTKPPSSPPFGEVTPMAPQPKEVAETLTSHVLPLIQP